MTGEEFKLAANLQLFGSATAPGEWRNLKASYTPEHSPVEVQVASVLLHRVRGAANAAKGIDTDAAGQVVGANERAKELQAQPASDEKTALLAEIDRRYYHASGKAAGSRIAPGDAGRSELWRAIRDEVLFQHHYIAGLPDSVKALIRTSLKDRDITPIDYEQLFRIAKKIRSLPPGAVADYASKITDSTASLQVFEDAIEHYRGELAAREHADTERTRVQNKLLGLEEVYKLYRQARAVSMADARSSSKSGIPKRAGDGPGIGEQLEAQLLRCGFSSETEFAAYVRRFEQSFEDTAVRITLDLLAKYAGKLHQESQRYQDATVVKDLHSKLAGFRAQHQAFDDNAKIWNDYAGQHNRDLQQQDLPGNGTVRAKPPTMEQSLARGKAQTAKVDAEASIKGLSKDYPIFAEDDLPVDKRLDKVKLAQASESQLGGVLQAHIADRASIVVAARGQLEGKHELIYKMDKLMPAFYAEMDIQPGSIHDLIIKDKLHDDAIDKLVGGVLLAVAAIALTVVSLGTATPAVVAAGASIGTAGLSTYMAYDEYRQYTAEHEVSEAGLAEDPSVVWLVLAIVGAGVDVAATSKAIRALAPAARALTAGGEVTDFTKAVDALRQSKQLDEKIAAAADKAAAARRNYAAAKAEFSLALGKAYSFPGPFTDPDVYRALVKMAAAKLKDGSSSLVAFIAELKQSRLAAKLGELAPEELTKAKQAWEDGERLANSAKAPIDVTSESGKVIGTYSHGSQLEIISKDVKLHGGNTIKLDPDATTTLTGTLDDTNAVARRGERLPGATQMGENVGGINILRSPKWAEIQTKFKPLLEAGDTTGYWRAVTNEFWDTVNKPWLDEAIARGDRFRLVSNPADEKALFVTAGKEREFVLEDGKKIQSIFGREVEYLKEQGYKLLADGTAAKVK